MTTPIVSDFANADWQQNGYRHSLIVQWLAGLLLRLFLISELSLRTSDTVDFETPAARATSVNVTRFLPVSDFAMPAPNPHKIKAITLS